MPQSAGLTTSGKRWGLSCEAENEAQMGVLLGYMKLFGATNIGFDVIGEVKAKRRQQTKEGPARRKRGPTASRKPVREVAGAFLNTLSAGEQFTAATFGKYLTKAGWKGLSTHTRALETLHKEKRITRKSRGTYARGPTLVSIVKKAS